MSLANLHRRRDNTRNDIQRCETQVASLQEKVDDLRRIHRDMKDAKSDMQQFQRGMRGFAGERYPLWNGDLYTEYQQFLLGNNQDNLRTVVNQVDRNMAIVNNQRTAYENEIFRQQGILGNLRATLNSILTAIRNWID
ncbi:MAG: DUF5082 family protein [Clostridia bacterium]|nr:DUF5082 family protein [Clostridia bacterium]